MNRFIPDLYEREEFTKEASVLGALGLAGLMHVTPNVAMKAVKSTNKGNELLAGAFSAGMNHGKTGRKLHPNAQSFMEYGVGPESLLDYHLGKRIGSRVRKYDGNPERQEVFMNRVKKKFNLNDTDPRMAEEIKKTPIVGSMYRAFRGEGNKTTEKLLTRMSVPEDAKKTIGQRAGNLAMLAGAGAADPHLLLQPAFSAGRKAVGTSELGKNMLKKNFEKAVDGKTVPKWKERITDLAVSPGVLDTHRIGSFANKNLSNTSKNVIKDNLHAMQM